jgi:hypothetical protein
VEALQFFSREVLALKVHGIGYVRAKVVGARTCDVVADSDLLKISPKESCSVNCKDRRVFYICPRSTKTKNKMKTKFFQILGVVAIGLFSFSSCETDACKDVTCDNGGTCVEGDCVCLDGFSGVNCETAWATAFISLYDGVDNCGFQYESEIKAGTTATALTISNAFGVAGTASVTLLTATTIQIPAQTINTYAISGSGTLVGSVLTIDYTIDGDDCKVVYTKK